MERDREMKLRELVPILLFLLLLFVFNKRNRKSSFFIFVNNWIYTDGDNLGIVWKTGIILRFFQNWNNLEIIGKKKRVLWGKCRGAWTFISKTRTSGCLIVMEFNIRNNQYRSINKVRKKYITLLNCSNL